MLYTRKKIEWRKCRQRGPDIVNMYGDITREQPIVILARKQPHKDIIKTTDGRELLTKSVFYVDPLNEPHALEIAKMDTLDGETIEQVYEMCDLSNKVKMIRFITV